MATSEVASQANVTRRSAAAILKGIRPEKFALWPKNPEEFIAKCARLIVEEKAAMVVDHVVYHEVTSYRDLLELVKS